MSSLQGAGSRRVSVAARRTKSGRRQKYSSIGDTLSAAHQPLFVSVHPDGSDSWRLDPILDILRNGGVSLRI